MDDSRVSRLEGQALALRFIVNAMLKSATTNNDKGRLILRDLLEQLDGFSNSAALKAGEEREDAYLSGLAETIEEAFSTITRASGEHSQQGGTSVP